MRALIEDSRQQLGKHEKKHERWGSLGVPIVRSKLPFGDYALMPTVAVDTKYSIVELHMDLTTEHKRFREECIGARDAGCRLVILVENNQGVRSLDDLKEWTEPLGTFLKRRNAKRKIGGKRLAAMCRTMSVKYGVEFMFCAPEESADIVLEILRGGEEGGNIERPGPEPGQDAGVERVPPEAEVEGA